MKYKTSLWFSLLYKPKHWWIP